MVKDLLKQKLEAKFPGVDFDILVSPSFAKASEGKPDLGDYSTNIAFVLAKKEGKNPMKTGEELAVELSKDKELSDIFEKIEAVKPGFVNFSLKKEFLWKKLKEISGDKNYGFNETMKGKTIMVEYTDPNPFKLFHIGHLMSNAIGESISRLYEALGAKVIRVNYQGDTGLHVAKAIWAVTNIMKDGFPKDSDRLENKIKYLGEAYTKGSAAYGDNAKVPIEDLNRKIYDRSDKEINEIYDL